MHCQLAVDVDLINVTFVSISIICQEHKYLKNCVNRIASLEPDVILVEKSVSRVAQQFLVEEGFTLIINVKPVSFHV